MPISDDLDERIDPIAYLERYRRNFESTSNPLYAWQAWAAWHAFSVSGLHGFNEPLPTWLGEYLSSCALRLIGVTQRHESPAETGEGPGFIGRYLGFSKSLAKTREEWDGPYDHRELLALKVVNLMWDDGLSLEGAASELDGRGASRSSARTAVEDAHFCALRMMEDRLRDETGQVPEPDKVALAYSGLCKARAR